MSGIGSEGLWFQQVTHSGCECEQCVPKSVCLLSPSVKGCEALESVTALFLLLKRAGFTAPTHAKNVEGQTHTLKGK